MRYVIAKGGKYWPAFTRVANAFPSVHDFVRFVNRHDHSEMIRVLQCLESIIVIEHVVPRLVRLGVPVLTLHDAIWGREKDLPAIEDAFNETFDDLGVRLRLKRDSSSIPCQGEKV